MALLLLFLLSAAGCHGRGPEAVFSVPGGTRRIRLELARTEAERSRGLMFRSRLADDAGMLFVFERPCRPSFWMKNTYVSLDILFLSADGTVVERFERVPPCPMDPCPLYTPRSPVKYALEVKAGFSSAAGVRVGDRVRLLNLPSRPEG